MPPRKRLSRDDWIGAALGALLSRGPDAVAIEPVAEALGATKGSGYWHFASRQDLLEAALVAWRQVATDEVIERIEQGGGSPVERMSRLLVVVSSAAERSPAEMLLMGSADPVVGASVREAIGVRLAYLERLLVESGAGRTEARTRAVLAYSAYLGHAMLAVAAPDVLPRRPVDRRRTQKAMLELATRAGGSVGTSRSGRA